MLAAQIVGKTDMELITLAQESECGLRRLIESHIVDSVRSLVINRHDVLAHDCINDLLLVVAPASLI